MKPTLLLLILLLFAANGMSQTVDIGYLNPKLGPGDPYRYIRFGTATTHYAGFMWNNNSPAYGDGNDFSIFTYGNRDITVRSGTGNFIVFPSSGGNVGIGTITPDSKLTVNGNIRAKEVKVEATNWPDYVFEEGYHLLPLGEVKDFIVENGHLPGLKSAGEYEREGVNITELNQKLLEKIEELTLYLIEKDIEIQELKSTIQRSTCHQKDSWGFF